MKLHLLMIMLLSCVISVPGMAATLSVSCPTDYVAIQEDFLYVANSSCSSGSEIYTAQSCLEENPSGSCFMFAPANMLFPDDTGMFLFTSVCVME